jgi:integrase
MQIKLTKALVEKTNPEKADLFLWDSEVSGFGVKITPKGKRIYVAQYRIAGQSRRITVGKHGVLTFEAAKDKAKTQLAEATLGGDPARAKIDLRHGPTVRELGARYLAEYAALHKKKSSAADDKAMLENLVYPQIGGEKAATVTRAQIAELHHGLKEKPYAANRTIALLGKMFNLAEKWGCRADNTNPCRHIEKFKEAKRKRFLSIDELSRLGAVLSDAEQKETEPPAAIAAIRALLFTGARLSEILTAQHEFYNAELGALILPDSKSGDKTIPLSSAARLIIEAQPVVEGNPFIFPGHRRGQSFVGLSHVWGRIRKTAGIADVRIHDLRHSFASVGAAAGLGLPIIGSLLGRTQASTTQRYAHLANDPLKAATELIGNRIDEAMKAEPKKIRRVK